MSTANYLSNKAQCHSTGGWLQVTRFTSW